MSKQNVYQIYYDENTYQSLDPGFIPISNANSPQPDWYEFYVIRKYLLENTLNEGEWYGFFSPKLDAKTGLTSKHISKFLEFSEGKADVALISLAWDQIAYFRNPFEQGEYWHPGLAEASQRVFDALNLKFDVCNAIGHTGNFAFSNFIVAKPAYWNKWLELANALYDLVENRQEEVSKILATATKYGHGSTDHTAPIKAFVQERMPFFLILENGFRTSTYDMTSQLAVWNVLFTANPQNRPLLLKCDELKRKFTSTNQPQYLQEYLATRQLIQRQE